MSGSWHEEVELKLGLSCPADLPLLMAHLPEPESLITQLNHYYTDRSGVLDSKRVMVRVREESESETLLRVVLTVKCRAATRDAVFKASEFEVTLEPGQWSGAGLPLTALPAAVADAFDGMDVHLGGEALQYLGCLRNQRRRVGVDGFILEVDSSEFPDGSVDVEVEVETDRPRAARAMLNELAASCGISLYGQSTGKYARFRARCGCAAGEASEKSDGV